MNQSKQQLSLRVLFNAIKAGDKEAVKESVTRESHLLSEVYDMELDDDDELYRQFHGKTALHLAAKFSKKEMVKLLLDLGADMEQLDRNHNTVLHWVSNSFQKGSAVMVDLLVKRGADVNAKNREGAISLHYAAHYSASSVVKELIKHGANVHCKDISGRSVLHYAVERIDANELETIKVITLLLQKGIRINDRDLKGVTSLQLAVQKYQSPTLILELLKHPDIDITAADASDGSALEMAANLDQLEVSQVLIQAMIARNEPALEGQLKKGLKGARKNKCLKTAQYFKELLLVIHDRRVLKEVVSSIASNVPSVENGLSSKFICPPDIDKAKVRKRL